MGLFPVNTKSVTVNTGNILSLVDITKKPGQNPTEELSEAIKITLKERDGMAKDLSTDNVTINRRHDDLADKITLLDRTELKIGIKLFINSDNEKNLNEAINQVIEILKIDSIDNIVLSYHSEPKLNDNPEAKLSQLKNLWVALENFARNRKIYQIGLSDIEEGNFRAMHEWANIKPSIIQINLATCCVVPPTLQAFCKEQEVQLLTHSDPSEILPQNSLAGIFGENNLKVNWALRFQVHIKCRGVLTTKGYLVNLSKQ